MIASPSYLFRYTPLGIKDLLIFSLCLLLNGVCNRSLLAPSGPGTLSRPRPLDRHAEGTGGRRLGARGRDV